MREIGFDFTLEKIDSLLRGSLNLVTKEMVISKSLRESIIMIIRWICMKNMEYKSTFNFIDLKPFTCSTNDEAETFDLRTNPL